MYERVREAKKGEKVAAVGPVRDSDTKGPPIRRREYFQYGFAVTWALTRRYKTGLSHNGSNGWLFPLCMTELLQAVLGWKQAENQADIGRWMRESR